MLCSHQLYTGTRWSVTACRRTWPFWERFDREHLRRCDELVVLMLDGWGESVGVAAEIRIAAELGKPVRHIDPHRAATLAHVAKEVNG